MNSNKRDMLFCGGCSKPIDNHAPNCPFYEELDDTLPKELKSAEENILNEIYTHLDSLPYAGGYPSDWQKTLAAHLASQLHPSPTPDVEDGKLGGEVKEEVISVIASALYNIRNSSQQPMMDTGKCDEISEFIYMDIKEYLKSQPSTPVQPGERINKVKDAIGFLLSCAYPEMIASEYNRNKEVLTEICKLIDTIATSTPVQDGWEEEKPNKECVFVSATKYERNDEDLLWDYTVWQIKKLDGEDDNGNPAWYFGLLNGDGEEWGPLEDLSAHLYKIIPSPPVNKQD